MTPAAACHGSSRSWIALLFTLLMVMQAGCAGLREPVAADDKEPATPPSAAAGDGGAAAPAASSATLYTLEVRAPDALRRLLETHLDLARFQKVADPGDITRSEVDRLIAAAPAQVRELLQTEGYFVAEVRATRVDGSPPRVLIEVEPGPRVTVGRVDVVTQGELQLAVDAGDRAAQEVHHALRESWLLKPGEPFTQAAWTNAKNRALALLRAEGYPLASWSGTSARIDTRADSASLYVIADSGPLFHLGELRVEGLERYDAGVVRNLSPFQRGDVYKERTIDDFQERLQKAGLFEAVGIEVDTDAAHAASAPVVVRARELPLQQATFGVGVSANTGPRVTLEHLHRSPFGLRASAKNKIEFGRLLRSWEGDLISHPLTDQYRNLLAGGYEWLESADEVRTSWRVRAGRTQDTGRIERLYFAELQHSTTETEAETTSASAASLNYHWVWRDVDNILLPTDGLTASAQTAGGYAFGSEDSNGPFACALARVTAYRPFGGDWHGQARVELGHIVARSNVGVPDPLLFRAGGDESVRGYGYRTLGPIEDGVVVSGRALFTASAEVAHPISPRFPSLWWAAFIDAGNAAENWGAMDPAVGYGVGIRWRSPVGPLKVDIAYGHEVERFRLHLSVGIAP
jgi:translocation and assembly module TamA